MGVVAAVGVGGILLFAFLLSQGGKSFGDAKLPRPVRIAMEIEFILKVHDL